MRRGVVLALVGALVTFVGLVFATAGTWILVSTSGFFADAERADGLVVDVRVENEADGDQAWYPVVLFRTASGQRVQFEASTGGGRGSYHRGERVPVAYDPDDAQDARLATFGGRYGLPLVFMLLGGVATLAGGTMATLGVRAYRLRQWLLRNGHRVQGQIVHAGLDLTTTVDGRHPYLVRARFQDPQTARTYQATSDWVWEDPRPALTDDSVVVLFDPRRPKRSLVELGPVQAASGPPTAV